MSVLPYTCELVRITDNTSEYQIKDSLGRLSCRFPEKFPRAANSFCELLNREKITTVREWKKQPHEVHLSFVMATTMDQPNFYLH